jgi:hypothetical protein
VDTEQRRPGAADVWAAATGETPHLPAVRASSELAVRAPETDGPGLAAVVFGVAAAVVAVVERIGGRQSRAATTGSDVALGLAWAGYRAGAGLAGRVSSAAAPAVRLLADPPGVPRGMRPVSLAGRAADAWRAERPGALRSAQAARDVVVPAAVDVALAPLDLTRLVVDRVDLATVVTDALDELDLTQLVLDRVDLGRLADAVVASMDLTEVARDHVDLVSLAQEVIEAIDLPEIIRESTGSVASDTVRSIRMQSIGADEGVQRIVDRVILWRRGRNTQAPADATATQGPAADSQPAPAPGAEADR